MQSKVFLDFHIIVKIFLSVGDVLALIPASKQLFWKELLSVGTLLAIMKELA